MPESLPEPRPRGERGREDLRADCSRCAGLCCVAPAFARSADFALDKPAGTPCPHLSGIDFGCTVHDELRPRGFAGCTTYDCFGAGQHVVQRTYGGATWRDDDVDATEVFAVFAVVRPLHELLWLLHQALGLALGPTLGPATSLTDGDAPALVAALRSAVASTEELVDLPPERLVGLDVDAHRAGVVPLLREVSALARAGTPARDLAGADLVAARLGGAGLHGASLRGALLLGADLRGADLRLADVTGADLRAADVRGTDLSEVLFLGQQQADSARGDAATALPSGIDRPRHWGARA